MEGSDTARKLFQVITKVQSKRHGHGLPRGEMMILFYLNTYEAEGVTNARISQQMHVQSPTVTQIVNRLVRENLVVRRVHPSDKRSSFLYLTDKAREMLKKKQSMLMEQMNGLVDYLGESRSKQVIELVELIDDYLSNQVCTMEEEEQP